MPLKNLFNVKRRSENWKVLLYRPGANPKTHPEDVGKTAFDDIPWLDLAVREHDYLADLLKKCGVEVIYLADGCGSIDANAEAKASLSASSCPKPTFTAKP